MDTNKLEKFQKNQTKMMLKGFAMLHEAIIYMINDQKEERSNRN